MRQGLMTPHFRIKVIHDALDFHEMLQNGVAQLGCSF